MTERRQQADNDAIPPAVDAPGSGATAPEPRLVMRETMAGVPQGRPDEPGREERSSVGRVDASEAVLGRDPTEAIPGAGEATASDLDDGPPDVGDPVDRPPA